MVKIGAELPKLSQKNKTGYPFFGPPCISLLYAVSGKNGLIPILRVCFMVLCQQLSMLNFYNYVNQILTTLFNDKAFNYLLLKTASEQTSQMCLLYSNVSHHNERMVAL